MAAESDIWRSLGTLSVTERRIRAAFPHGEEVDLRTGDAAKDDPANADDWPPERTVRAGVLAALLLGAGRTIPGRVAALRLRGARITGPLLLSHGTVRASWLLEQCRIDGHVDVEGSETGSIYLRGTHLRTLSADSARVRGVLALSDAVITGTADLALRANGITVDGELRARALTVLGPLNLIGADIHGQVVLTDARISNPGGESLQAGGMRVGRSLNCRCLDAVGQVRLPGVVIGSDLLFNGARLDGDGQAALSATSLTVAGDVSFRQELAGSGRFFEARGMIWLQGARIGGSLLFSGAKLDGEGGAALHARRVSVAGSVNLDRGFTTSGEIRFNGAAVVGHFDLEGMTSPDALLKLYGASISGGIRDVGDDWPDRVDLDGLVYGPFDPYRPPRDRLRLLARQVTADEKSPGGFRAQPYEQLAASYRSLGNDSQARTVLLAKFRAARRTVPRSRRIGGYLLDGLVGYGYRPMRAVLWALATLVCGSAYFATVHPTRVSTEDSSVFNPVLYTADRLIPVVRFGQPDVWQFHGPAAVVSVVLTLLGWTLGIAIAAGATRTLTRN